MTSTDRLVAGVIAALLAPGAKLYVIKAAFGVVIVCVAFATTMELIMTTTVAKRMTPGRENFWIRILIVFICWGFFCAVFLLDSCVLVSSSKIFRVAYPELPGLASLFVRSRVYQMSVTLKVPVIPKPLWIRIVSALATWMSTWCSKSIHSMWVPAVAVAPPVMVAPVPYDSKPTHAI